MADRQMYYPANYGGYRREPNAQQIPQQGYPQNQCCTPPAGYDCWPVTSREEAMAVQVNFFGPGTIMPDLAHGVIYLKRFNQNTGISDLITFAAEAPKAQTPVQYATLDDLNALREELTKKQPGKTGKKGETDE